MWGNQVDFSELQGKTFTKVEKVSQEMIRFTEINGHVYEMYHDQDCCEWVSIDDICGELAWLENTPILSAYESTNSDEPRREEGETWVAESFTWTFYQLRTRKGSVTIRWYGESNGYYSESVSLHRVDAC